MIYVAQKKAFNLKNKYPKQICKDVEKEYVHRDS